MTHYINSLFKDKIFQVLTNPDIDFTLDSDYYRNRLPDTLAERIDVLFSDGIYIAARKWPSPGVDHLDFKLLCLKKGTDFATMFKEEVDVVLRQQTYALIPMAVKDNLNTIKLISSLKEHGCYHHRLQMFVDANIIEFVAEYYKKKTEKIQLTTQGVSWLKKKLNILLKSLPDETLDELWTSCTPEDKRHEIKALRDEVIAGINDNRLVFVEDLRSACIPDFVDSIVHEFNRIDEENSKSRLKTYLVSKKGKQYHTLACGNVIGMRTKKIELLSIRLEDIGDRTPCDCVRTEELGSLRSIGITLVDIRRFKDLSRSGVQPIFTLFREDLVVNPEEFAEVTTTLPIDYDFYYNVVVLGKNASTILGLNEFKYDWLDLTPEIRRVFSENGICPLGIQNKEKCEQTWKEGTSITRVMHKDINGLRVELSSAYRAIYFFPRNGGVIDLENLVGLYNESKHIFDELKIETYKIPATQPGFEYEVFEDRVEFKHKGSRYISLSLIKSLCAKLIHQTREETMAGTGENIKSQFSKKIHIRSQRTKSKGICGNSFRNAVLTDEEVNCELCISICIRS
jgi:hypothetical protein